MRVLGRGCGSRGRVWLALSLLLLQWSWIGNGCWGMAVVVVSVVEKLSASELFVLETRTPPLELEWESPWRDQVLFFASTATNHLSHYNYQASHFQTAPATTNPVLGYPADPVALL